jgi:hypothetical protein
MESEQTNSQNLGKQMEDSSAEELDETLQDNDFEVVCASDGEESVLSESFSTQMGTIAPSFARTMTDLSSIKNNNSESVKLDDQSISSNSNEMIMSHSKSIFESMCLSNTGNY